MTKLDKIPDPLRGKHRQGILISIAMVVLWFMISGVFGPLFGSLSNVQKNDNSKFLPAKSPSQVASVEIQPFVSGVKSIFPVFVLFEGKVANQNLQDINVFASQVPSMQLVDINGKPFTDAKGKVINKTIGEYLANGQSTFARPNPSKAAAVYVFVNGDKATDVLSGKTRVLAGIVSTLRYQSHLLANKNSLTTHTTGIGALFSDLFGAFGGIDGKLLYVTLLIVAVILIVVYRSPLLWILPLLSAGFALTMAGGVIYLLAKANVLTLDGQSQGILSVLVLGAATDYALLLIARFREELHLEVHRVDAMKKALRGVFEPIFASGSTVTISLFLLLLSSLSNNRGLGPVGAIGVICAMLSILTFLPALLVLFGRWIFWPKRPHYGTSDEKLSGLWSKIALSTSKSPVKYASATILLVVFFIGFLWSLQPNGLSTDQYFTTKPDSVVGLKACNKYFPAGSGEPSQVVVPQNEAEAVGKAIMQNAAVANVEPAGNPITMQPTVIDGKVLLNITMKKSAEDPKSVDAIAQIRTTVAQIDPKLSVGGTSGVYYDIHQATKRDQKVIIPAVLFAIAIILALLLRSIIAGLVLLVTVIISYLGTLGASAIAFHHIFHFQGVDTSFPIYAFIFLVALGIDYNIFLMTRVREESLKLGTKQGVIKGVTVTGGVITSAGIVLAATFSALGSLPLVFLAELAFTVAFGVLLDTLIIRSLMVPALVHILGDRIWWPTRMSSKSDSGMSAI